MTDELQVARLATSIAEGLSPVPRIHGAYYAAHSQLYPLLLSPLYGTLPPADAATAAHVLNVLLLASAALPAYLLARAVSGSETAGYVAGALTAVTPWLVLSSTLLTENAAYAAFAWSVLLCQRAVARPGPGRDAAALAGLALAFVARTQLVVVAFALPLALILHELGWSMRERSASPVRTEHPSRRRVAPGPRPRLPDGRGGRCPAGHAGPARGRRRQLRRPVRGRPRAGRPVARGGRASRPGRPRRRSPPGRAGDRVARDDAVHADRRDDMPLRRSCSRSSRCWSCRSRRSISASHRGSSSRTGTCSTSCRCSRSGAPPWLVLQSHVRTKLVSAWAPARPVVALLLLAPDKDTVIFWASPAAAFRPALTEAASRLGLGDTDIPPARDRGGRARRRPARLARTAHRGRRRRLGLVLSERRRPPTCSIATSSPRWPARRRPADWIDAAVPNGSSVALVPGGVDGPVPWWEAELWNRSVDRVLRIAGGETFTPFPALDTSLDREMGRVGRQPSDYLVVASGETRFGLAASRTVALNRPLRLLRVERPCGLAWASEGLTRDGWMLPGRPVTVRVFGRPAPERRAVQITLASSRLAAGRIGFAIAAGGETIRGTVDPGGPARPST